MNISSMLPIAQLVAKDVLNNPAHAQQLMSLLGVKSVPEAVNALENFGGIERGIAMQVSDFFRAVLGDKVGDWIRSALMFDATEKALEAPLAEYMSEVCGIDVKASDPGLLYAFFSRYDNPSEALKIALVERHDFERTYTQLQYRTMDAQLRMLKSALGPGVLLSLLDMSMWDTECKEYARRKLKAPAVLAASEAKQGNVLKLVEAITK